jgi:small-conductance mechanosensitive channel
VGAAVLAFALERLTLALARRLSRLTGGRGEGEVLHAIKGPLRLLLGAVFVSAGERIVALPARADAAMDVVIRSLVIVAFAWLSMRSFVAGGSYLEQRASAEADPARLRALRTQLAILRRIVGIALYVITGALLLLQFPAVRNVGVSLLASAGIVGLVLGVAAQRSLGSLFAGVQLSLAQPIRIGDSILFEGEFGTVDEINLTYVVMTTWDFRRIVLPINYFLDKPFQNWSKGSSPEMIGTVALQADFSVDVDAIRAELKRILAEEGRLLWDGKSQSVQVTDANAQTLTLRVLVSAADSGKSFDLRCLVREKLVAFLARKPEWLPQARSRGVG